MYLLYGRKRREDIRKKRLGKLLAVLSDVLKRDEKALWLGIGIGIWDLANISSYDLNYGSRSGGIILRRTCGSRLQLR